MKKLFTLFFFSVVAALKADPTDTLGVSLGSTPQFAPTGQITLIPYAEGYVYGTNNDPNNDFTGVGQGYVNDDQIYVRGVISFIALKAKGPQNLSNIKITFNVHNIVPNGAINPQNIGTFEPGPGAILLSKQLFFEEIDTNFTAYTGVTFDSLVPISGDLAVSIDFTDLFYAGDTMAILL